MVGHSFNIVGSYKHELVTVHEFEGIQQCNGAVVLDGCYGIGVTSSISSGYLVEQLNLEVVGCISSTRFPALGHVAKGQPLPGCRLYGNSVIIVLVCDFKIVDDALLDSLVDALFAFAVRNNCSEVVTVDGIPL